MFRWVCIAFSLLLFGDADIPRVLNLRPSAQKQAEFPADQSAPGYSALSDGQSAQNAQKPPDQPAAAPAPQPISKKAGPLRPQSRLAIVRYVSGEFARAKKALPGGKKGLHLMAGQPLDDKVLRQALANGGAVINPGDSVQITRIEFRDKEMVFDVNGGTRRGTRLRDKIHIEMSGAPMPQTTVTPENAPAGSSTGSGSMIVLEFGRSIPEMTPDDLKQMLGAVLDFSKQRSAAVQWVETLPPEYQQAIKDKHAVVGMNHDEVVAAMGKPDRKVRERDATGVEMEDWIYGQPPDKMTFVTFNGDKVVRIRDFN